MLRTYHTMEIGNESVLTRNIFSEVFYLVNDKIDSVAYRLLKRLPSNDNIMTSADRTLLNQFLRKYNRYKKGKLSKDEVKHFVKEHKQEFDKIVRCLKTITNDKDFSSLFQEAMTQGASYGYGNASAGMAMGVMAKIRRNGNDWINQIKDCM